MYGYSRDIWNWVELTNVVNVGSSCILWVCPEWSVPHFGGPSTLQLLTRLSKGNWVTGARFSPLPVYPCQ